MTVDPADSSAPARPTASTAGDEATPPSSATAGSVEHSPKARPSQALSGPAAALAAWLAVAACNAIGIATMPFAPHAGLRIRLAHHAFDFGHTLALGLLACGLAAAAGKSALLRRRAVPGLALFAALVAQVTLRDDLRGAVERLELAYEQWVLSLASALAALAVPASFVVGRALARGSRRAFGLAAGVGLVVANGFVLRSGYPGLHFLIATCGATLLATNLAGLAIPGAEWLRLLWSRARARMSARVVWLALSIVATTSVLVEPGSSVQVELLSRDTTLLFPWLQSLYPTAPLGDVAVPPELRPWYESREGREDIAPSSTRLLPDAAIVIVVTIDALRMEVFEPKLRHVAPHMHGIRERSVYFSQARASASDTRYSLATLFTGLHSSMLRWEGNKRPTLRKDPNPRLPERLEMGGVTTVNFVALENMMVPRIGIVRGFSEHVEREPGAPRTPRTEQIVDQAIERLRQHDSGPLFLYTHLIDPHQPYYTRGKQVETEYDAYLLEVSFVDGHIGRLRKAIAELGLEHRVALIIGSDHGEGFGEHGVYFHNKTLYDVMVHVPLMIEVRGVKPRVVDQFVALADVGPTVLDLFGLPIPGQWVWESLVPFLTGGRTDPTRPILMEKRNDRALLFPDGLKVITRRRTQEIYDVLRDPEELRNLRDSLGPEGARRVALLNAYVDAHSSKRSPSALD